MATTPSGDAAPSSTLETFGSYRLVWLLCRGGMAELYLATRSGIEGFEKVVALKRILPSITQDPSFIDMFLDEARLAAKLDHPNIVRIYDLGEISRQYFMAMEYLPGEDLREVWNRARDTNHRIPVEVALTLTVEVAVALEFAHTLTDTEGSPLHLVHRDVSPSNIIVTYHGAVKLVDFGIAKARNSSVHTQAGSFKGKLAYASPEQLCSEPLDRRSDIFGMGIVLWELLTGKRLFSRDGYAAIIDAVKNQDIPAPSSLRKDVSPALDRVVLKALAREKEDRYQSALEFQRALEEVLAHLSGHRTARHIAEWLRDLFSEERANVKNAIAQGKHIDAPIEGIMQSLSPPFQPRSWSDPPKASLAPSANSHRSAKGHLNPSLDPFEVSSSDVAATAPRELELPRAFSETGKGRAESSGTHWSHSLGLDGSGSLGPRPRAVAGLLAGIALFVAVLLIGIGGWYAHTHSVPASSAAASSRVTSSSRSATLTIESDPPGAAVFINGEPTGSRTPATLPGLPVDRSVQIRLDLPGYSATRSEIALEPGQATVKKFELKRLVDVEAVPE